MTATKEPQDNSPKAYAARKQTHRVQNRQLPRRTHKKPKNPNEENRQICRETSNLQANQIRTPNATRGKIVQIQNAAAIPEKARPRQTSIIIEHNRTQPETNNTRTISIENTGDHPMQGGLRINIQT
ncbi:hypothetical protein L2E82_16312 [Cichorium intybus]|uniref:Uncharacterized protein n=1 Tax=Cichorium intybus TaxID=13427 RepID=A0ACB9F4V9_CICIN|nr:hypothetical protein L2E82_16312 [Cichorium intybus]